MKKLTFNRLLPRYAYSGQFSLENMLPIPHSGTTIGSNLTMDFSGATLTLPASTAFPTTAITGAGTFSGAISMTSTLAVTGAVTPTGGVAAAGGFSVPTVYHTGGYQAMATTGATQKQIVTTETYYAEVFIPANATITGVSILNGHTTNAGVNLFVGLANSSGTIVANSNTTTAQSTADAFQQIAFTTTYAAKGPAKYFICIQGSTTTGFLAAHAALGNFGAAKVTGETYGTFLTTASYSTTTYTASLGPIADTY